MKRSTIFIWILKLISSGIMLQTLYFKFSAAPESVHIFSTIGMEPWGRIGIGVVELIASFLILYPKTTWLGALLGIGVMSGAIFFHLFFLRISVMGDGGNLFALALITFVTCSILLFLEKDRILDFLFRKSAN